MPPSIRGVEIENFVSIPIALMIQLLFTALSLSPSRSESKTLATTALKDVLNLDRLFAYLLKHHWAEGCMAECWASRHLLSGPLR